MFGAGRFLTKLTPDRTRVQWETKISTMEDYQPLSISGAFAANPGQFLGDWGANVLEHVLKNMPRVFGYAALPFVLWGLVRLRRTPRSRGLHLFGVLVVSSAIGVLSLFYDSPRLLLAYLPIGALWAAAGILEVSASVPTLGERRLTMLVVLALGLMC